MTKVKQESKQQCHSESISNLRHLHPANIPSPTPHPLVSRVAPSLIFNFRSSVTTFAHPSPSLSVPTLARFLLRCSLLSPRLFITSQVVQTGLDSLGFCLWHIDPSLYSFNMQLCAKDCLTYLCFLETVLVIHDSRSNIW